MDNILKTYIERASESGELSHFILPDPTDYASIPQDPNNPLNAAKVQLGQMLFFETGLALDAKKSSGLQTYSCASCHLPTAGFKPGNFQGVADGGVGVGVNGEMRFRNTEYAEHEMDVQGIRPLSVMNVAFVPNTLWNGQFGATHANEGLEDVFGVNLEETDINLLGYQGLESQNIEGLELHRMVINRNVAEDLGYKNLFDEAFPEFVESERYSLTTGSFAISAYLRTLLSTDAPFQQWLKGDLAAMSEQEKRGAVVFFGQGNCYACHSSPNLGSNRFFALGVNDLDMIPSYNRQAFDTKNLGRGGFTGRAEDMFKFKVPQLYNLEGTKFYYHGSSKTSLSEVVEYFDAAIPENPRVPESQISPLFRPLNLSEQEKIDLTAFLSTALEDPAMERYAPDSVLSGNCFPNNDLQSRIDMGCD
jgi:cytochrome c peroxidase